MPEITLLGVCETLSAGARKIQHEWERFIASIDWSEVLDLAQDDREALAILTHERNCSHGGSCSPTQFAAVMSFLALKERAKNGDQQAARALAQQAETVKALMAENIDRQWGGRIPDGGNGTPHATTTPSADPGHMYEI